MLRRNSVYSYLSDPNSHALDKEKNAKYSAESNMLLHRSNSNLVRFTQDDNIYHSRRKNVRQNVMPAGKHETESSLAPTAKYTKAASHIRSLTSNAPLPRPTTPRSTILPKTRGSMSYQVQHRRSMIRSSLTDISLVSQKEFPQVVNDARPERRISASFLDNSQLEIERNSLSSPRKINSNASSYHMAKSPAVKNSDSDDEKTSEAVCSGDYVADTEDVTMDDISSYTSDDCWTDQEYHARRGGPTRDVQTQTLLTARAWYQSRDRFMFHNVQRKTETCRVHTTTLYAKRSHSDTSIRRTKLPERPSTSPSQFVAQSTKVLKLTTTTECSVRPQTSPAFFDTKSIEVCQEESTICHSLPTTNADQQLAKSELRVPETIKTILKPLEYTNETAPRCTMSRGVALSLAASFLLFLGLLWTGITVSLATHRIVTQYLYPPMPEANSLTLFLQRLSKYFSLLAHWVWYKVYY